MVIKIQKSYKLARTLKSFAKVYTDSRSLNKFKYMQYILKFNSPDLANGDNNTAKQMKAEEML